MNSRAAVAIILALTVFSAFAANFPIVRNAGGMGDYVPSESMVALTENLLFAIIGALSGYIAGKDSK